MEDGSVVISILGDRKQIAKELEKTRKDIEKTEKELAKKTAEKSGIEESLNEAMQAASATNNKIRELKREYNALNRVLANSETSSADYSRAAARQMEITRELQVQAPILRAQDAEADRLHSRYEAASAEVEHLTANLAAANTAAADLVTQDEQAKVGEAVRKQLDKVSASAERFQKRTLRIFSNTLLYNVFSSALRNAASYFGQLLNTSKEYQAQMAKLKGALLTAFQPLYDTILPWAISLLRILTSITQVVANFLTLLFGTGTLLGSAKAAETLQNQANAISGVGAAAKEAEKQLASFDQINKLNGNSSSDGGGGSGGGVSADFSDLNRVQTEEYQQELNRLTAILSGSLLALGAILFFTGANIPLGLGLMAAGAIGLANLATGKWGEVTKDLKKTLTEIFVILGASALVIGAILTFSGTGAINIARGIALMAIGAAGLVSAAALNWDSIPNTLKDIAVAICAIGGYICTAVGIVIAFSGHVAKGIGLIMGGIALLGGAAFISWTYVPDKLRTIATEILEVGGVILTALGAVMFFAGSTPKHKAIGMGCIIAGAAFLAGAVALNWDSITSTLMEYATPILEVGGVILTALGVILVFTGHIALGLGSVLAGASCLAGAATLGWGSVDEPLLEAAYKICKIGGPILIAVGMALLFSGAGTAFGLGMIVAGLETHYLADAIPWNDEAGKRDLLDTISSITKISGDLFVAVGLMLIFSGAGIPLGLGLLAAGAALVWEGYSMEYDDSGIEDQLKNTEAKLRQMDTVADSVESAKSSNKTVNEFSQELMQQAFDEGWSGEMLYQALAEKMKLSDEDMAALGFRVMRDAESAYISGIADGVEDSTITVGEVMAQSLTRSINSAAEKVDEGSLSIDAAAELLNNRVAELLKAGVMSEDEIVETLNNDAVKETLSQMGLSFTDGYIRGMDKESVAEAAADMTQAALAAIANTQDSHSPAKKTESLGKDAVDGYVNGVVNNVASVESAGEAMVTNLATGMANKFSVLDTVMNYIVDAANSMADAVVTAANAAVDAMTSVSFSGSTIRIPTPTLMSMASVKLPKLATGKVIPPNAPFAAILGDQRNGTNVEAPLSTIQQAVSDVVKGNDLLSAMKEQNRLLQSILDRCDIKLDGRSITETVNSYQRQMSRASGGDGYGSI